MSIFLKNLELVSTKSRAGIIPEFDDDTAFLAQTDLQFEKAIFWNKAEKSYKYYDGTAIKVFGESSGSNTLPTGSVIWLSTEIIPDGYLECNGAELDRTTYSNLFQVIGEIFGAGDGSSTFLLPDFRGVFIRGYDNNRGYDSGRVFGSYQSDEYKSHTHSQVRSGSTGSGSGGGEAFIGYSYQTHATQASGGSETRGKNIALKAVIKY